MNALRLDMKKIIGIFGLAILAVIPLFFNKGYFLTIIFQAYLFAALASSWNIIGGLGGQISFGHAVFFGVGAYTTAILFHDFRLSPWISMWIGAFISCLIGIVIAFPTFRLRGPFFSIATLIINELVLLLALYFEDLTGGSQGIIIPYQPSFSNLIFENTMAYVYITFGFLLITVAISFFILKSKLGYYLQAIREDQDAARILGISPFWTKMSGFLISVWLTSMGGSIYAMYIRFIEPKYIFSVTEIGVMFALMCMIGGMGTIAGPIIGALIIVPIDMLLRGTLGGTIPGLNIVVFSVILILFSLFFRQGIVGVVNEKVPLIDKVKPQILRKNEV